MTFEEYLTKRRVNVAAFAAAEPQRFAEWQNWFGQMHPESFYTMVKMVLNDVRRNYWLAEVPKPVVAIESAETTAAAPPRPAGRRAAIPRPAASGSETTKPEIPAEALPSEITKPITEIPETKPAEATTTGEGTAAPKPGRPVFKPRGVIKKPTASEETKPENSETVKPVEAKSGEEAKPANENADVTPAKPARPRAVIKRPAALNKPESKPEETAEKTLGNSAEKVGEVKSGTAETLSDPTEKPEDRNLAEAPKTSRPRPVFKRPSTSEPKTLDEGKTLGEMPDKPATLSNENEPTENPVAKPGQEGASEAKAVSEEIQQNPEAAKAAEEVAAEAGHVPKPPRPRPVFKRPAAVKPPETLASEAEKALSESAEKPEAKATEITAEEPEKTLGNSAEKVEEPVLKPPRPRPVFKRPIKPENDETGSS